MSKLQHSENFLILGIFLGITGLLAALVLAVVSSWTSAPIAAAQQRNRAQAIRQLRLPEFDNDPASSAVTVTGWAGDPVKVMTLKAGDKIVGYAATASSRKGYGGEIEVMTGFSADGKITAVQVLKHKETPGLGAAVCERKFRRTILTLTKPAPKGLPPNVLLDQFDGRDAKNSGKWAVSKDGGEFEYKTGATVTSRAIVMLVDEISGAVAERLKK